MESGLNVNNSGFIAKIPVDSIEEGIYKLGIYIKKGDIEALQYTDSVLTRTDEVVELSGE